MIRTIKTLFLALIIASLTSCAKKDPTPIIELNVSEPIGSPFNKTLAREYSMLSKMFTDNYLARKGLAANDGIMVMPETVRDIRWEAKEDNKRIIEETEARVRLIEMMQNGGREKFPEQAALAQTRYDCWVLGYKYKEPLLSPFKTGIGHKYFSCKRQFVDAMNMISKSLNARPDDDYFDDEGNGTTGGHALRNPDIPRPYMFPAIDGFKGRKGALAGVNESVFLVFFDWDKANINKSAKSVLDAIADELRQRKDYRKIVVTGHADTSGEEAYNQDLSIERAINVSSELVGRGIAHGKIKSSGKGEKEPLLKTGNNVREPTNRRVEITLE